MKTEQQQQLVTFAQSTRLQELGFDWETICAYDTNTDIVRNEFGEAENWNAEYIIATSAPTTSVALKYLRDAKGVKSGILPRQVGDLIGYGWWYSVDGGLTSTSDMKFNYEDAESELLDRITTALEEQINNS